MCVLDDGKKEKKRRRRKNLKNRVSCCQLNGIPPGGVSALVDGGVEGKEAFKKYMYYIYICMDGNGRQAGRQARRRRQNKKKKKEKRRKVKRGKKGKRAFSGLTQQLWHTLHSRHKERARNINVCAHLLLDDS